MKSVAVLILFIGAVLIVRGYYEGRGYTCPAGRVEVKYIPKTLYDEQLSEPTIAKQFQSMFESAATWPATRG